jgi:hypothetical protein
LDLVDLVKIATSLDLGHGWFRKMYRNMKTPSEYGIISFSASPAIEIEYIMYDSDQADIILYDVHSSRSELK